MPGLLLTACRLPPQNRVEGTYATRFRQPSRLTRSFHRWFTLIIAELVSIAFVLTLLNSLTLISQVQAAPEIVSVNRRFSAEISQFRWADLGESDLRLAQMILIPDLPELEPTDQDSRPGAGRALGNRENAGHSGDLDGAIRSGDINNRPHRKRPRGEDDDDDNPRHRESDNDDDD